VARVDYIQTNFTAGEISPRLLGRVDVARFKNGLKTCLNAVPQVHGGAKRAPGTRYAAETKDSAKYSRLIPFIFNRTQAFILEFGDAYVRFYTTTGRIEVATVPVEVASPYQDDELDDIHYVQSADTMFLFHPSYPIYRLVRLSNTSWKLSAVPWQVQPSEEKGDKPATTLTLSSAAVGTGRTATAAAACFEASDVGRQITSGAGLATITAYTSTTVVTVTIVDAFASAGPIASQSWTLTESPKTGLTPSVKDPEGAAITLTAAAAAFKNSAQVTDIGKFVEINAGLVEITAFSSSTVVTGVIRSVLNSTTAAASGGWALRSAVWNATDGYPRCGTLFEQRLICAGSPGYPQTLWGSRTGEYYNFSDGVDDSDGFAFTIASDQINPIEHLASTRILLPMTYGGEFSMMGGNDSAITPTNVQIRSQTAYGVSVARPVRVSSEIIFVTRGGEKIRALGYRADIDSFNSPDVSILSEHIPDGGIYEMAYAQEPDQVVWMVRADGVMPSMSIDRDQDVIGWARRTTDGLFESVASIPNGAEDQVWVIVKRTIDGADVRYVEYMDSTLNTDCAVTGTSGGAGTATWTGLDHLEGETVDVVADGVVMPQQVVTSGAITIPRAANAIEIGLHYESEIETLEPEVQAPNGTSSAAGLSVHEAIVRFYETSGATVQGETIPFRQFGGSILDTAITPFTGDKKVSMLGDNKTITVQQTQPLPWQVLAVIMKVSANG
jgi:hypothetical protein